MDAEQELLSMMSNDILSEAYKETLKDLDLEESVIDILTKDLISKMENKLHREITRMDDKDIHMVPPKNIYNHD
jgi:hypothetical protein